MKKFGLEVKYILGDEKEYENCPVVISVGSFNLGKRKETLHKVS